MNLGVWGGNGSFTEEAALTYVAGSKMSQVVILYFESIESMSKALSHREIDMIIFPVRNTIGGIVREAESSLKSLSFGNIDMFDMEIHQNLLVYPGTKREQIQKIISHYQPLKQTARYIKKYFSHVILEECDDMSVVAKHIALTRDYQNAVIASRRTAELYGLEILRENIEDVSPNITTFLITAG